MRKQAVSAFLVLAAFSVGGWALAGEVAPRVGVRITDLAAADDDTFSLVSPGIPPASTAAPEPTAAALLLAGVAALAFKRRRSLSAFRRSVDATPGRLDAAPSGWLLP